MADAAEIWAEADLVVKVKEPQPSEWPLLRPGQVVFTYFHFAADEALTRAIIDSGITAIAYETLRDHAGGLPLLTPMSEVAGRMSIQEGAKYLERPQEGRGILLSGVPGVAPAEVAILGGGVVGSNAAKVAAGLGANVRILDINLDRLRYLDDIMPPNVTTLYSDRHTILESIERADLVIGAVLITGARAPRLVRREDLARMKNGAVIVDVAIDQGDASRPAGPRPIGSRPIWSTAWSTTASPTCPAPWAAPAPMPCATSRCLMCCNWPSTAGETWPPPTPASPTASTSTRGA